MSKLVLRSIERSRKLNNDLLKEDDKRRGLLISYLINAKKSMKDDEELTFHNPIFSRKRSYGPNYSVRLLRSTVIEEKGNGIKPYDLPLLDYLSFIQSCHSLPISGVEKAIEDVKNSSIEKRIKENMVRTVYDSYERLKKEKGKVPALIQLLN